MTLRHARFLMIGLVIAALFVSAASAFAVIVHDAEVQAGGTVTIPVEIDEIPVNIWYYQITLAESDPTLAEMVDFAFPSWPTVTDNSTIPADTLTMSGGNLTGPVPAGTQNVSLGSITVRGDNPGSGQITVTVDSMETDNGVLVTPATINGNLVVEPATGSIHVTSNPSGAEIWIDNVDSGQMTEFTIDGVTPGDHTVNVTLAGYEMGTEQTVTVVAGETVNADFQLVPLPTTGSIHVTSNPSGAEIFIDNVDSGQTTEFTIDGITPGDHVVNVTLAGYEMAAEQTVTVVAGETAQADFVLTPVPTTGSIHVTSTPSGAEIFIDNVDSGQTTEFTIDGITPGDHVVNVTLAGYELAAEQTVTVVAGETVNADFQLVPLPTTGSIHVTSTPSGAEIFIDDGDTGMVTEATISYLAPGFHVAKVTMAGYEDAEQLVTVVAGETIDVNFQLVAIPSGPKAQFLAFPRQGTAPLTVLFIDVSQGSPSTRLWDFGDGSTSTEMFPLHTFNAAGKYTVRLTVKNKGGSDTMTREDFITVNGANPPKAQFIAYPRQGTAPMTVLFLDVSQGSPSSRLWDFGDGTTSTDMFPLHTYVAPGKYTVKLTVTNSGGSDTLVRENFIIVRVGNPPKAQFTAYPQDGAAPLAVTFLDLSRGYPSSRVWDFGDGASSTDINPVHVYEKPGKYTVTLTVTNDAGSDTVVRHNFITVDGKKQKVMGENESGQQENESGGRGKEPTGAGYTPLPVTTQRPQIKIG